MDASHTVSSTDILICGAGPVGSAVALALHAQGRQVQIIDRAEASVSGDDRSLGLTTGTVRFLDALGVWSRVQGAEPIRSLHISERGRFGRARVHARDHGLEHLGATVPAQSLHDALEASLRDAGITVQRGTTLTRMDFDAPADAEPPPADLASPVCYADNANPGAPAMVPRSSSQRLCDLRRGAQAPVTVSARLVIGADGHQSQVRQLLGIPARTEDYGQVALVSQLDTGRDVDGCAFERFDRAGPIALMPRGRRRVGVIWMRPVAEAERLMRLSAEAFAAEIQQAFGWRLGRLRSAAPILRWPLQRVRAQQLVGPRALLIGNAAASFHPVAAQGFNLAMRDAQQLAEMLSRTSDPGAVALLARFAADRQADHQAVERMTDGLVKMFGPALPGLAQLRSLGLLGLDVLPPLQRGLVTHSAGARPLAGVN
ncbi:MAG: FAD-dependent monooxygenase [Oceanococcaceae bacterium]